MVWWCGGLVALSVGFQTNEGFKDPSCGLVLGSLNSLRISDFFSHHVGVPFFRRNPQNGFGFPFGFPLRPPKTVTSHSCCSPLGLRRAEMPPSRMHSGNRSMSSRTSRGEEWKPPAAPWKCRAQMWVWVNIKSPKNRRCWSVLLFTRATHFGVTLFFDPQPCLDKLPRPCIRKIRLPLPTFELFYEKESSIGFCLMCPVAGIVLERQPLRESTVPHHKAKGKTPGCKCSPALSTTSQRV